MVLNDYWNQNNVRRTGYYWLELNEVNTVIFWKFLDSRCVEARFSWHITPMTAILYLHIFLDLIGH
jgi:hypothetical protein